MARLVLPDISSEKGHSTKIQLITQDQDGFSALTGSISWGNLASGEMPRAFQAGTLAIRIKTSPCFFPGRPAGHKLGKIFLSMRQ